MKNECKRYPHEVPWWLPPPSLHRDNKARPLDCHAALVNVMWGLLEKDKCQQEPKGPLAVDCSQLPDLGCRGLYWLQGSSTAASQLLLRQALESIVLTLPPPQPQEVLPTWHDDIRKSQFSCNRQSPIKYHGVFSPYLFHVSTKKLERNDEACKNKSIFFLSPTLPPCIVVLDKTDRVSLFPKETKETKNAKFSIFLKKILMQKIHTILKKHSKKLKKFKSRWPQ